MAGITVRRHRRDTQILIVTREAGRVAFGCRLKCALLQPERISEILRRLGYVFFIGSSLRLIGLMTDGTTLRFSSRVFPLLPADGDERCSCIPYLVRRIEANHIKVFIVREVGLEFGDELLPLGVRPTDIAQAWKYESRGITWRYVNVAVGTDYGSRSLAGKKLLPVAVEASRMLGKLRHIRKRGVTFANFLPVLCRKFVTGIARKFLLNHVSVMREMRIVDTQFWFDASLTRLTTLEGSLRRAPSNG